MNLALEVVREAVVVDSVTQLDANASGAVVVTGSHGGWYAAFVAARRRVRAAVFNDAGVGRDRAGIAGLGYLEDLGVPAAAVGHDTARIGDGADTLACGVVRHVNEPARSLGCVPGTRCGEAARLLARAPLVEIEPPIQSEARSILEAGPPRVWAIDSASLARPEDAGCILVTGSHGGLLGGKPETALKVEALAALFNDAGTGRDRAGLTRLPALDRRGIAAATVSAESARIGDARSTYEDGIVSAVNRTAAQIGAVVGMSARAFVAVVLSKDEGKGKKDEHGTA